MSQTQIESFSERDLTFFFLLPRRKDHTGCRAFEVTFCAVWLLAPALLLSTGQLEPPAHAEPGLSHRLLRSRGSTSRGSQSDRGQTQSSACSSAPGAVPADALRDTSHTWRVHVALTCTLRPASVSLHVCLRSLGVTSCLNCSYTPQLSVLRDEKSFKNKFKYQMISSSEKLLEAMAWADLALSTTAVGAVVKFELYGPL